MKTKEGHSNLLDWGPILGLVLIALSPLITKYCLPEEASFHQFKVWMSDNAWPVGICGIFTILVVAFWHSFCQWDELNEKRKPNLDITLCSPEDGTPAQFEKNRVFLLGITNSSSVDIEECLVELVKVEHGKNAWTCNAKLAFQPHEEFPSAVFKTLRPDVPYKVDILFIQWGVGWKIYPGTKVNGVTGYWNRTPSFQEMLFEPGEYFFHLIISAKEMYPTRKACLKFTYAATDSRLELMPSSAL